MGNTWAEIHLDVSASTFPHNLYTIYPQPFPKPYTATLCWLDGIERMESAGQFFDRIAQTGVFAHPPFYHLRRVDDGGVVAPAESVSDDWK